MGLQMTEQLPLLMTSSLTIEKRKYLKSHPWLKFGLNLPTTPSFWVVLGECQSKCEHISGVPLRPDMAKILHEVYLAKGAWGTVAIEGNTLSEAEAVQHVRGKLNVSPEKEYLKQELDNIVQEFNRMVAKVQRGEPLVLSPERIKEINGIVLKGLSLDDGVEPGEIRNYSVGVMNYRGAPFQDCGFLFARLCDWLNGPDFEPRAGLGHIHMAILKAVIAHLYVEWIHAFGDGNGRTGRLIEAQLLLAAGVPSPACHLLSNHYNRTRKEYLAHLKGASESGGDVIPFMTYAMNGLLDGLKGQLGYIRKLQMETAWVNYVHDYFRTNRPGKTGDRHKILLLDLINQESPVEIADIDKLSSAVALEYHNLHVRTKMRDVDALKNFNLLFARERRSGPTSNSSQGFCQSRQL